MQIWLLIAASASRPRGDNFAGPAWSGLRIPVGPTEHAAVSGCNLDVLFLAGSAVAFWQMASTGIIRWSSRPKACPSRRSPTRCSWRRCCAVG